MLLGDELDAAARHAPRTMALAFGERSWTFAEWNRASLALAARVSAEVAPGARVAVLAHNHPTVALALSAVPRARRVLSLPNQRLHPAEIADVLADVDAALVIGPDNLVDPVVDHLSERGSTPLRWRLPQIDELLDDHPAGLPGGPAGDEATRRPHDPAWIIHTSGTTGTPKGVVLTHASLLAGATTALFGRPVGATDTYLYPFPLCHVSAHNVLALHLARRPVVLAERFEAGLFWDLTRRFGATMASLAPTMLAMLLDDPATASVPAGTLRAVGYGSRLEHFLLSMTRAAARSTPLAKEFFCVAIKARSFDDARKFLGGNEAAATDYFKGKTAARLTAAFQPIVDKAMNEVEVTRQYKELIGRFQAIPFDKTESFDLHHYVTEKSLGWLFDGLGQEEKKIRTNPAARVTDLLKEVFGK